MAADPKRFNNSVTLQWKSNTLKKYGSLKVLYMQ